MDKLDARFGEQNIVTVLVVIGAMMVFSWFLGWITCAKNIKDIMDSNLRFDIKMEMLKDYLTYGRHEK